MTATAAGSAAAADADLAARFAASLARLHPAAAGPVGLAVSGGADSLALLLLTEAVRPGGFAVATVDHGLRAEAAAECAAVAKRPRGRRAMPRWPAGRRSVG